MIIDVENSAFALGGHEDLTDGRLGGFNSKMDLRHYLDSSQP